MPPCGLVRICCLGFKQRLHEQEFSTLILSLAAWFIGTVPERSDVLPPVNISLLDTAFTSAAIERGVILLGSRPLTNLSEVIALAEGKEQDPADNSLFFEPGRLLYHSIEFCNLVHVCTISPGIPSIVIRECLQ